MSLTVDELIEIILSAHTLEKLQQQLRDALIGKLYGDADFDSLRPHPPKEVATDREATVSPELDGA